jgi:hypothetical protein
VALIEINWKPSPKEVRQFAGLWLVIIGSMGAWSWYQTGSIDTARWFWLAAVSVGGLGLLVPAAVRPLYVGWIVLAFPIGWTVSHVLLGAIYYLILTPVGLILRLVGHDPMNRTLEPDAETYWVEHRTGEDPSRYFKQF